MSELKDCQNFKWRLTWHIPNTNKLLINILFEWDGALKKCFADLYFLCDIYSPEPYSEPDHTSKMDFFVKILNGF